MAGSYIPIGGRRGDRRPAEARGAHGGAVRRGIGVAAEDEARYRGCEIWEPMGTVGNLWECISE